MPVDLYRVDDRLIHGQVVVGWGRPMETEFIVLVDDQVAETAWEQDLYRMGVPPEMALFFESVADATQRLAEHQADPRHGIVLTGDIETMVRLVEGSPTIREINLGGVHHRAGRTQCARYVFLTDREYGMLRSLAARGIVVMAQDVPSAKQIPLEDLMPGGRPMTLEHVQLVILLGAVLGLDVVSFPQAMISRPIVAATLAGMIFGEPGRGLVAGAALELIALETMPFGASRYPEWGSAGVIGGAAFSSYPAAPPGTMVIALLVALVTAWIGGWTMVGLRQLNGAVTRRARSRLQAGSSATVTGLQMAGLITDLVRGALVTALALSLLPGTERWLATWQVDAGVTRAVAVGVAAAVASAGAWKLFHGTALARWFILAGAAAGVSLAVMR